MKPGLIVRIVALVALVAFLVSPQSFAFVFARLLAIPYASLMGSCTSPRRCSTVSDIPTSLSAGARSFARISARWIRSRINGVLTLVGSTP